MEPQLFINLLCIHVKFTQLILGMNHHLFPYNIFGVVCKDYIEMAKKNQESQNELGHIMFQVLWTS